MIELRMYIASQGRIQCLIWVGDTLWLCVRPVYAIYIFLGSYTHADEHKCRYAVRPNFTISMPTLPSSLQLCHFSHLSFLNVFLHLCFFIGFQLVSYRVLLLRTPFSFFGVLALYNVWHSRVAFWLSPRGLGWASAYQSLSGLRASSTL